MEHKGKNSRQEWRASFEAAIHPLASSITVSRYGLPTLDNAAYRTLAEQAKEDPEAALMVQEYLPRIHVDAGEVVELIVRHPEVGQVFDGEGMGRATFATMPGNGFRIELKQMAERVARIAVLRGEASAASELDEFLSLASRGQLPGYEVTVIRGLTVEGVRSLGPGTTVTTYGDAVRMGWVRARRRDSGESGPDHEADGASVLIREMTWSPCLVAPHTLKPLAVAESKPTYVGNSDTNLGIVLNCLSLVTEQRVAPVRILSCAPRFTDIDPNFGPGSGTGWAIEEKWRLMELTDAQASDAAELLQAWKRFKGKERWRLELGLARLVSFSLRDRGGFLLEDRILDVAVALEVLYGLGGGELTHKLSIRAANFLGVGATERRLDIFAAVKELYRNRSGIVHGSKRMDRVRRQEARDVVQRGFEIGRETLVTVLNRGNMPDWEKSFAVSGVAHSCATRDGGWRTEVGIVALGAGAWLQARLCRDLAESFIRDKST